jgi:uncharacterized protein YdcH (DUF465 family)
MTIFPLDAANPSAIVRICRCPAHINEISPTKEEDRMATVARNPRDLVLESDAAYQRLAEQHERYEAELHQISASQFLSSEDLLEEIRLKKLKLHVKDEMIQLAARLRREQAPHSQ